MHHAQEQVREPWTRQPGETSRAFRAFAMYRDMGPSRSLRAVCHRLTGDKTAAKLRQLEGWSSRWRWVTRAQAWDAELDRVGREAEVAEIKRMRQRHIREAIAVQERAIKRLQEMDPADLTPLDVVRFIMGGAKLERLSRDLPEPTVHHVRPEITQETTEPWALREQLLQRLQHLFASSREAFAGSGRIVPLPVPNQNKQEEDRCPHTSAAPTGA